MARQIINVGAVANDGTGDALRFAFTKTNDNFAELYNTDGDLASSIASVANNIPTDISQLTDEQGKLLGGDYNRLFNKPFIPHDVSELSDNTGLLDTKTEIPYLQLQDNPLVIKPIELGSPVSFVRTAIGTETDQIDTSLRLARGAVGGLYNADLETQWNAGESPAGTLWNNEGWGDLSDLRKREYTTFYDAISSPIEDDAISSPIEDNIINIIGAELIMWDTQNGKFYKFEFTDWGQNNGGSFAYNRTLISDYNYFEQSDYGRQIDILVENDPIGSGIALTRGAQTGLHNPYQETFYDQTVSPRGTLWNIDGWNDLRDITSRSFKTFFEIFDGNIENDIIGKQIVVYLPDVSKYYAIRFLKWNSSSSSGGIVYERYEIDTTKLSSGIIFPDGSVQNTAYIENNIISTAPNRRKITTESGFIEVLVDERSILQEFTGVTLSANTDVPRDVFVDGTIYTELFDYATNNQYSILELEINGEAYDVQVYTQENLIVMYNVDNNAVSYSEGDSFVARITSGGDPVKWVEFSKSDFRGAIIDYHAYFTNSGTMIGTIYMANDSGDFRTRHIETYSGNDERLSNYEVWHQNSILGNENELFIRRRGIGPTEIAEIHWNAKIFYGQKEFYD